MIYCVKISIPVTKTDYIRQNKIIISIPVTNTDYIQQNKIIILNHDDGGGGGIVISRTINLRN